LLVVLLYPVISVYRYIRIGDRNNILSAMSGAMEAVQDDFSNLLDMLNYGAQSLFLRLTGVESLTMFAGLNIRPLGWSVWDVLTSPSGVAGYVTLDVMGFPSYAGTSVASGMVGWFYLVGGDLLVVIGIIVFTLATYFAWIFLGRMGLYSLPVAQAISLSFLFMLSMDGVLDGLFRIPVLFYPLSIFVCELLMRLAVQRRIVAFVAADAT
jgi:hypothetical protein